MRNLFDITIGRKIPLPLMKAIEIYCDLPLEDTVVRQDSRYLLFNLE